MTNIKIVKTSGLINSIEIKGHTGYDVSGKDIAAVSSIVYTTINAIHRIKDNAIEVQDESTMEIKVLMNDEIVNDLIENMFDLLKNLAKDYPKNLIVKES